MNTITLPAGTIVKINGIPFELKTETEATTATATAAQIQESPPYEPVPLSQAFTELRAIVGDCFDNVGDPNEFADKIRRGDYP